MAWRRDPNAPPPSNKLGDFPIAKGFAGTVLIALLILIVLRHLFGSVRLEVGSR